MPTLSIVIPTFNRLKKLQMVLSALEQQEVGPDQFEVVVVSDGSTDGTDEFLKTYQTPLHLQAVFQQNQGVAVARNTGTQHASGELILFVDDDVKPAPCLVSEHLRIHQEQGDKIVVLGPMLTPDGYKMEPWVEWEQMMLEKQYQAMINGLYAASSRQFFTGNTSLARKYLIEVGGFDPSFRRAEDVELAYRLASLGLTFVFNPEAIGYHYAERSYQSWSAIPYAYGKNDVIFTLQKNHHWLLKTIYGEFQERHAFTRVITYACLDHARLSNLVVSTLKKGSIFFHRLGVRKLSTVALSGIFNLTYYQGVSDQLGGRAILMNELKKYSGPARQMVNGSEKL